MAMKPLNLDSEIIATRYDPASRTNFYTVERDGRRWTVSIHTDDFDRCGPMSSSPACPNKKKRRDLLGKRLQDAMKGPADGEV